MGGSSRKHESILDAAAKVFVQEGYDNSSMDRIADTAGASKRTVYNHFPSKEELFMAVMNRFLEEVHELKKISYKPEESLERQLDEFLQTKAEIARNPAWLGLMKVSMGIFFTYPDLGKEILSKMVSNEDMLVPWLKAATADGRMAVDNAELAAEVFWAAAGGAFFWPSVLMGAMDNAKADMMKGEIIQMFLERHQVR